MSTDAASKKALAMFMVLADNGDVNALRFAGTVGVGAICAGLWGVSVAGVLRLLPRSALGHRD